jgi:hypothetical protein
MACPSMPSRRARSQNGAARANGLEHTLLLCCCAHLCSAALCSPHLEPTLLLSAALISPLLTWHARTCHDSSGTFQPDDGELSGLFDALKKNSSLTRLNLADAGLTYAPHRSHMQSLSLLSLSVC